MRLHNRGDGLGKKNFRPLDPARFCILDKSSVSSACSCIRANSKRLQPRTTAWRPSSSAGCKLARRGRLHVFPQFRRIPFG